MVATVDLAVAGFNVPGFDVAGFDVPGLVARPLATVGLDAAFDLTLPRSAALAEREVIFGAGVNFAATFEGLFRPAAGLVTWDFFPGTFLAVFPAVEAFAAVEVEARGDFLAVVLAPRVDKELLLRDLGAAAFAGAAPRVDVLFGLFLGLKGVHPVKLGGLGLDGIQKLKMCQTGCQLV